MTLAEDIASWDTKDKAHIARTYAKHHQEQGFHESLLSLLTSPAHQDGATWLFKHALDEHDLIPEATDPNHITILCNALSDDTTPASVKARIRNTLKSA